MESVLPICRICLNVSKDFIDFQTRFECDNCYLEDTSEMNYLQCLCLCTNIPIDEGDGGPQSLCTKCATELQLVYKFVQKVKSSQYILEESLKKNCLNNEHVEHTDVCIETCDWVEIESLSTNTECASNYPENASEELPNIYEKGESSGNNISPNEETSLKENEEIESIEDVEYLLEDDKTLQNDSRIFMPKKYKCYICNRSYVTEHHLKVHLYYHKRRSSKSPPYTCKICGESFSLHRFLTQHMIEHQDCRETYKCKFCDKEYVSKTALISHKRIHQAETLKCTECGKQFSGSYEFRVHLRFHKREKEADGIKCNICYKEFSSSRYLPQHMAVHMDSNSKEKHSCNYCNKEYSSKSALNNHKRLHEGQTLQCNVCKKHFTRNCELQIHMRFHKREHPFKCALCEKAFVIKGHLRAHMWQHQRLKVACDNCGKLFGSIKSLNEHSQMPFPCEFCDKGYPSKQKYKVHLEMAHPTENTNKIILPKMECSTNSNTTRLHKKFKFVQILKEDINY